MSDALTALTIELQGNKEVGNSASSHLVRFPGCSSVALIREEIHRIGKILQNRSYLIRHGFTPFHPDGRISNSDSFCKIWRS